MSRASTSCPICAGPEPADVLAQSVTSWVTAEAAAPLPGYVCVISKRHVVEPFDLSADQQVAFWRDCMLTARAAREAVAAVKVNYEIHGNTVPHLHMHIFPRHRADPFVGGPIDGSARNYIRSHNELCNLQLLIGRALRDGGPGLST